MVAYNWILICASFVTLVQCQNCRKEQKCRTSRIHGMKSADCFNKDFRNFPQCITNDVEIIDLSQNRIRKLSATDLNKYSSLKMLYLADNKIVVIDEEAFKNMRDLNTLDLSLNAIQKVPPVVFQLPSLKSLYLGQNMNMNIANSVEKAKPVTASLIHLDLSYIMSEEPDELPDLGVLPLLTKYNISGNKLSVLSTRHFAGLCSLKNLDTTNVTADFEKPCDCWTVNTWLRERKIKFTQLDCELNEDECFDDVPSADLATYAKCMEAVESMIQKSRLMKILIPIAVIAGVLLLCLAYFLIRRRKQRMRKMRNKAPPKPEGQMLL